MTSDFIQSITILRVVVGYLGEKEQCGWWSSSFFSNGSDAFLSPIFPRTQLLAQCTGVTRAATILHDERIGIGDVYHLFRLPEEQAQGIHDTLQTSGLPEIVTELIASKETALQYLQHDLENLKGDEIGPVCVGDRNMLSGLEQWDIVRAYYARGFLEGVQILPYFSGGGR